MKKTLQIANGIAFVSTVVVNYLSNTGLLNGKTIGSISDNIRSLFTPAGYTFAIWGLIYMMLLGFVIYQGRSLFVKVKNNDFVLKTGWWFVLSCVFNSSWVFAWLYGYTGLSCVFIFLLLFSLLKIVVNNRMELDDVRFPVLAFVCWPFVVYSGWVTVASIANVSSYLVKIDWNGFGIPADVWTIIMIVIASLINVSMVSKRNMREFAVVGAWALIGIGQANANTDQTIMVLCYVCAVILLITVAVHGFKNFSTNPFIKFQQWRKE